MNSLKQKFQADKNQRANSKIISFGAYLPEIYFSTDELEQKMSPIYDRLNLPQGRLYLQTKIARRGYFPKGSRPSSIATKAAEAAITNANLASDQIDLLIYAGVCRDFLEPSTASFIHRSLNLKSSCHSFDLSNACLGMLSALDLASQLLVCPDGPYQNILIVTGENSLPLLDQTLNMLLQDENLNRQSIKPLMANLSIGSMGLAFIVQKNDQSLNQNKNPYFTLGPGITRSNSLGADLCQGSGDLMALQMQTQAEELLHLGVKLSESAFEEFLSEFHLQRDDFDHIVTHQVGQAHENLVFSKLGLNPAKSFSTYETFGNTGSAALPFTLMELASKVQLKDQDRILLLGIGSGVHVSFRYLTYHLN